VQSIQSQASISLTGLAAPLSVTMLGGARVLDGRFYRVAGESQPKNLDEVKSLIRKRQADGLRSVEIVIHDDSVARDHAAVAALRDWAAERDLRVTLSFSTSGESTPKPHS
jgi:hypothetical protein